MRHLKYIRDEDAPLPDLSPVDEDAMFARACWLWGMAKKLIAASSHPDFGQLVPHIKYVVTSEVAQNVPGQRDQEADKLFELVVALAILPRVKNLRVDTGKDADRNPDLMFASLRQLENRVAFKEGDAGWVFPTRAIKSKPCALCAALGKPAHEGGTPVHLVEGKQQRFDKKKGKSTRILPSPHRLRDTYTSALVEVGGVSPFVIDVLTIGRRAAR